MNINRLYFCFTAAFMVLLAPATVLAGDFSAAELPPNAKKVGDLKPTFYWVALEASDSLPRANVLLDVNGALIAKVSDKFFSAIRMEGTGRLLDGRVVNFHARVGKEVRWRVCPPSAPYGYGLENFVLKPFRSVAVDPSVVPIPSRVYIPAAKGALLPDGSVHEIGRAHV